MPKPSRFITVWAVAVKLLPIDWEGPDGHRWEVTLWVAVLSDHVECVGLEVHSSWIRGGAAAPGAMTPSVLRSIPLGRLIQAALSVEQASPNGLDEAGDAWPSEELIKAAGVYASRRRSARRLQEAGLLDGGDPEPVLEELLKDGWPEHRARVMADFIAVVEDSARPGRPAEYRSDHYIEVAEVYSAAHLRKQPPRLAVAEHFSLSPSTAAKHVAKARELGLLGDTRRGKAGGVTSSGALSDQGGTS